MWGGLLLVLLLLLTLATSGSDGGQVVSCPCPPLLLLLEVADEGALVEAGARDKDEDKASRGVVVVVVASWPCRRTARPRDCSIVCAKVGRVSMEGDENSLGLLQSWDDGGWVCSTRRRRDYEEQTAGMASSTILLL